LAHLSSYLIVVGVMTPEPGSKVSAIPEHRGLTRPSMLLVSAIGAPGENTLAFAVRIHGLTGENSNPGCSANGAHLGSLCPGLLARLHNNRPVVAPTQGAEKTFFWGRASV
jgi:hypothetical protein